MACLRSSCVRLDGIVRGGAGAALRVSMRPTASLTSRSHLCGWSRSSVGRGDDMGAMLATSVQQLIILEHELSMRATAVALGSCGRP